MTWEEELYATLMSKLSDGELFHKHYGEPFDVELRGDKIFVLFTDHSLPPPYVRKMRCYNLDWNREKCTA